MSRLRGYINISTFAFFGRPFLGHPERWFGTTDVLAALRQRRHGEGGMGENLQKSFAKQIFCKTCQCYIPSGKLNNPYLPPKLAS